MNLSRVSFIIGHRRSRHVRYKNMSGPTGVKRYSEEPDSDTALCGPALEPLVYSVFQALLGR